MIFRKRPELPVNPYDLAERSTMFWLGHKDGRVRLLGKIARLQPQQFDDEDALTVWTSHNRENDVMNTCARRWKVTDTGIFVMHAIISRTEPITDFRARLMSDIKTPVQMYDAHQRQYDHRIDGYRDWQKVSTDVAARRAMDDLKQLNGSPNMKVYTGDEAAMLLSLREDMQFERDLSDT